jgi:hypothetical protein
MSSYILLPFGILANVDAGSLSMPQFDDGSNGMQVVF